MNEASEVAFKQRVARNVRYYRLRRGWTQEDLARATEDLVTSTISNIERGKLPHTETLALIAQALGVDPVKLMAPILPKGASLAIQARHSPSNRHSSGRSKLGGRDSNPQPIDYQAA
jgi:transcriptional regulator with XRE-family HTH domain